MRTEKATKDPEFGGVKLVFALLRAAVNAAVWSVVRAHVPVTTLARQGRVVIIFIRKLCLTLELFCSIYDL